MSITNIITNALKDNISKYGDASLITCGGRSPIRIFTDLTKTNLDWQKINISLTDERLVSNSHKDSNELLINKKLRLGPVRKAKFISLLDKNIGKKLKSIRPFTVTLIGMGADGHFASLFPEMINNDYAMRNNQTPGLVTTPPLGTPTLSRVSMNLSMLLRSKLIILLVFGDEKMQVLENAKANPLVPIYHLISQDTTPIKIECSH